ncbi:MAG: putative addiction module component family protein [Daejeonella sp.]|nr:putative addiction module component family protein [Daejeonella sp.]
MRLQVIQDGQGKSTGIFIPIEDWALIKTNYPDIDNLDKDIPEWQKQLLDDRLEAIAKNPSSVKPIDELFKELESDI